MEKPTNCGSLLGYHLTPDADVVDDGPVDQVWASEFLDRIIARNRAGPTQSTDSLVGLYREGDLNALEFFIFGPADAEVIWDFRYGPNRFWIFESISYNRRIVTDLSALYVMLDLYCANEFKSLRELLNRMKKPGDFRMTWKS